MSFTKEILDFSRLSEKEIKQTLNKYGIPLTVEEILKVQNEFLGRPPSLAECVLFSIEGSEHCSYKSSRNHLKQFNTSGPHVVLGAKEDAGVVAIATDNAGDRHCIVMSHESHNHPSQLVPYEGAATGIGGNVRDVCCMGAEVIACADALRFGDIRSQKSLWIHEGVVDGIGGYGNPLGIPNIGGDLYYDKGYNDNCLVNVITLGIVRENDIVHSYAPPEAAGHDIILVGKPTDNSGFGGASFASLELEEEEKEKNKGAVQEPNAFLERHLLKATNALFQILKDRDALLKVGFKDLGAGGISCAGVELAETSGYGAEIWLDKVHTSMKSLHPSVILCSETQERFMWVSPPDLTPLILDHYNNVYDLPGVSELARASIVGRIKKEQDFIVHWNNEEIVDAPAPEVTRGFLYDRPYKKPDRIFKEPDISEPDNYNSVLLDLLSHENIASRKPVYETYDKQVQGRTIQEAGISDAGVLAPFNSRKYPEEIRDVGLALSVDHNPRISRIDPYWGAVNAVVESMRNIAAVGAYPIAMTDCLCFGNPEKPEQMWEFVEATRAVAETTKRIAYKEEPSASVPIIAGNVSFYNESKSGPIPASPIISCLGKIPDVNKAVSFSFKSPGNHIILIGQRKNECGGSAYYGLSDLLGANIPKPDLDEVQAQIFALSDAIMDGFVLSAHDISDGGLAVALAEMSFSNNIGFSVEIDGPLRPDQYLFSETGGFVLEVSPDKLSALETLLSSYNIDMLNIGKTDSDKFIKFGTLIELPLEKAKTAWSEGLREKLF